MRSWGDQPAHLVTYTTRLIRAVCAGEGRLSESLRLAVFSPTGSVRVNKVKSGQLYPLPLSSEVAGFPQCNVSLYSFCKAAQEEAVGSLYRSLEWLDDPGPQ